MFLGSHLVMEKILCLDCLVAWHKKTHDASGLSSKGHPQQRHFYSFIYRAPFFEAAIQSNTCWLKKQASN